MKISPKKYAQALAATLEGNADSKEIIRNLLHLLRRKKQFKLLPKIILAFEEEWNARRGVIKMKAYFPAKFSSSMHDLEKRLAEKLQKTIALEAKSSETLLGGFRIQIDDTLIGASIETRLKNLERRFMD